MYGNLSISAIADGVAKGEFTAEQVADEVTDQIARLEPSLHAFLHHRPEEVRTQALRVDAKRARGETLGPLAGVPIAVKDALCTIDMPSTAGSKILEGYRPPYDATVIRKLREADAILVGKTNMDEFAMGSSNENSAYGPCRNPWDLERIPGGSSGGSAVAVAARMAFGALGSDTGGSIRQPAALTGIVGMKPTYGRVSRFGLIAYASSLDQVGPFASDVRGTARLLSVLSGHDPRDATSLALVAPDFEASCGQSVKGLRLGIPEEYFSEGLDPEVNLAVREALRALTELGCTVKPVRLPHTRYAVATYYIVATAEASSNLSRFDGVRFGLRVGGRGGDLSHMIGRTRDQGFGVEVKRRILLGTFVLSSGYYEAYYLKAQKVRTLIRRDFEAAFRDVDAICSPTSPTTAFPIGERTADPLSMYLADIYTLPASLAGLPGISVPAGNSKAGLPIGLQIVAPPLMESTCLSVAAAWESQNRQAHLVAPFAMPPGNA